MIRLHLLGIYHRTIHHRKSTVSLHFRQLRRYPTQPKTFGEHLRKKRIDLSLSMPQLSKFLNLGVSDATIEKWEKDKSQPSEPYRSRIVEFLGIDPAKANSTGDS
ncbi:MAG TPA: helix-turn-helix transcriptional regulator [Candidatus Limnocylindrales bacterium]|nr:helix-turn-helix transcriptional regulator [Candidatus Limnocylindrales bacterium]